MIVIYWNFLFLNSSNSSNFYHMVLRPLLPQQYSAVKIFSLTAFNSSLEQTILPMTIFSSLSFDLDPLADPLHLVCLLLLDITQCRWYYFLRHRNNVCWTYFGTDTMSAKLPSFPTIWDCFHFTNGTAHVDGNLVTRRLIF